MLAVSLSTGDSKKGDSETLSRGVTAYVKISEASDRLSTRGVREEEEGEKGGGHRRSSTEVTSSCIPLGSWLSSPKSVDDKKINLLNS